MPRKDRTKRRLAISIDPDLYDWLEARVGPNRPFGSMTHAIETAVVQMKAKSER
jgi:hypothetical protein